MQLSLSTENNLLTCAMFDNFDGNGRRRTTKYYKLWKILRQAHTDSIFGEYSIIILVCEKNEIVLFIES